MEDCLFCKINNGEVDSLTIYEDEKVKVMMDAFPNKPGHTLIITKEHYKDLDDIPSELAKYIIEIAKKIKPLLEDAMHPNSVVLVQNNGEEEKIKHFHLHLIPQYINIPALTKEEAFNLIMKSKRSEI